MNAIECEKLTRRFGRVTAVDQLDLSVPAGSIYALLGPNGAGKTTTLRLLLNLLRPTSGVARILGRPSHELGAKDFERIGYVTEEQQMLEWMTVAQLVDFCRPLYPRWDDTLTARLLRMFDLPTDRPIRKLSRGMRMKAALLSSLGYRPELLVLDEPFSGLDPLARDDFVQGVLELPDDDRPRTIIVSTHDLDEVERLADHVGFLAQSRLLLSEPADVLRARFRRVEVTGVSHAAAGSARVPVAWLDHRRPTESSVRFVHSAYSAERSPAELAAAFPGAQVETHALTLREIFVALARTERSASRQEAA